MTTAHPALPTALPYAGTTGYSGSDTSEEMARREADDGTAARRQEQALALLQAAGPLGMTVKAFRESTGHHHGKASSTLSSMHEEGLICRLTERRDRCAVYVLPEFVRGRETAPHGRRDPLDDYLREWLGRDTSAPRNDPSAWSKAGSNPRAFIQGLRALTGYGA